MGLHGRHQPHRVLVVDDNDDLRLLVRHWLGGCDRFDVVGEASSGAAAIEAARRLQPDLAVMDVSLPNGDGEEATRIIGSVSPRTKVLAYSASVDRAFVLAMIGAGVNGYLVKSGHLDQLIDALDAIASGSIYLSDGLRAHLFDHVRDSVGAQRAAALPLGLDHRMVDLALRPHALQIALQPVVDLTTNTTIGHEALARFAHTDRPGDVFAAADRIGRSTEVELVAARCAADIANRFHAPGRFISINASPDVLMNPEFAFILARTDPSSIVVELTEQIAVRDYSALNATVDRLRLDGFRLAIDDVGGGFASLSHVHRLRPDIIKVDRYLIENIQHDPIRRSMVAALVDIAANSDALLIAEGIQEASELHCLEDLGVKLGQGFLLGTPTIPPAIDLGQDGAPTISIDLHAEADPFR